MWTSHMRLVRGGIAAGGLTLVSLLGAPAAVEGQWLPQPAGMAARLTTAADTGDALGADTLSQVAVAAHPELRSGVAAASHRSPLLAGFLGVIPGLGHAYAGEPRRGLAVAGVWFASGLVMFSSSENVLTGTAAGVNIASYVFSIADAVLAAQRYNRRHSASTTAATGAQAMPVRR